MKCSFCGVQIRPGTGKMYVKTDGTVFYWCSSKCEKNYGLGREPKSSKWAKKSKTKK